jgi:hypothetical protein
MENALNIDRTAILDPTARLQLDNARSLLRRIHHFTNVAIAGTPTGPTRDRITEANIHLLEAESIMESIAKADADESAKEVDDVRQ